MDIISYRLFLYLGYRVLAFLTLTYPLFANFYFVILFMYILCLGITYALATLSWTYFEKPIRNLPIFNYTRLKD